MRLSMVFTSNILRLAGLVVPVALCIAAAGWSGEAAALCAGPPDEEGDWYAVSSRSALAEISIDWSCQDVSYNGYIPPSFEVNPIGDCTPTDCNWGWHSGDWASGWVYSRIDQGFVTRHVWAKMSAYYSDTLYVYIFSDFDDPSRRDYTNTAYFWRY